MSDLETILLKRDVAKLEAKLAQAEATKQLEDKLSQLEKESNKENNALRREMDKLENKLYRSSTVSLSSALVDPALASRLGKLEASEAKDKAEIKRLEAALNALQNNQPLLQSQNIVLPIPGTIVANINFCNIDSKDIGGDGLAYTMTVFYYNGTFYFKLCNSDFGVVARVFVDDVNGILSNYGFATQTSPGVEFKEEKSANNLPQGNTAVPPFSATTFLSATKSKPKNGIGFEECLVFAADGNSFAFLTALANGSLRFGLHVIASGANNSQSDSYINCKGWAQKGGDIDGEAANDFSGWSISLNASGNIVAIGANGNSDNGFLSGHVRVYELKGSNWVQLGQDIDGEAIIDFSGFSVSLNASGDIVAIGATGNDGNGTDSGHTRVYQYVGTTWVQLGQDIDGEAAGDESGYSVSLNASGDIVAIGARTNDGNGVDSGHTRVYQYVGTTWIQLGQDIDGEAALNGSGYSVSINASGDIVAIGARRNDDGGTDSGHTRVYQYVGTTWVKLGQDIDGEAAGDQSGHSVSLNASGDIVAIGALRNDDGGTESGHTRVYQYVGTTWVQLGQDIDGEATFDRSGDSVSLNADGTIVAIGATGNDDGGTNSGHTRVYQLQSGVWVQIAQDIDGEATNDLSGTSVSLNASGNCVAIGAFRNDGNGSNSGHTRVYQLV